MNELETAAMVEHMHVLDGAGDVAPAGTTGCTTGSHKFDDMASAAMEVDKEHNQVRQRGSNPRDPGLEPTLALTHHVARANFVDNHSS